MTASFTEQKLQKQLEAMKSALEFYEREFFATGTEIGKRAAAHFATLAMGAGATLEEVAEYRVYEETGKKPSYWV